MNKRAYQLQSMLGQYAQQILAPMQEHFQILSTHLGKDLARQIAVAMVRAKLKLDAAERGTPLSADALPGAVLMQRAVDRALWDAELPFQCDRLIGRESAGAVRNLLRTHCGVRGRRRLPEGPQRAQGGRRRPSNETPDDKSAA
ncbi:MAG: hypothetical protein AMXMBFR59_41050 [Rhodanobacteraceae bacterium]